MAVLPEIFIIIHFNTSLPQHVNSFTVSKYQAKKNKNKKNWKEENKITKGLGNNHYLVLTDMRVPQGDHEDFKFLGISNASRQDFGHLESSIDCIYPFFLWKNPGVMLIVAVPRPWGSSALYLIWWQYNFNDQHILVWLRMIFKWLTLLLIWKVSYWFFLTIYMRYWPSVRSRRLDIGQVPFCLFQTPRWRWGR